MFCRKCLRPVRLFYDSIMRQTIARCHGDEERFSRRRTEAGPLPEFTFEPESGEELRYLLG